LTLTQQGDFWRGTLAVDSASYPALLLRRGPAEPAVYRVQRDEIAGPSGQALLFSPADETLPGIAVAVFPTADTAPNALSWADALAREGYTILLLPAADTLAPAHLTAALTYLHRTPGVDTARIGAWAAGTRAPLLATMLTEPNLGGPRPAFVIAQGAPFPTAAMRPTWRTLARTEKVLGLYEATDAPTVRTANGLRTALANPQARVLRDQGSGLVEAVVGWLRELRAAR
jgi:dienelactone hydrolase